MRTSVPGVLLYDPERNPENVRVKYDRYVELLRSPHSSSLLHSTPAA